ncbi:ABC transporter ATP-binding protein [uncultured Jannaschia sp.]|uniref:ABC transporter ATP-binding protein n=1 Tax=uncultured Jannaschia sp. TaxID=293347 RepID=UPI0026369DEC|nr:ABC transporter ATP-binding protein [uncultured Jannaschia sp.]
MAPDGPPSATGRAVSCTDLVKVFDASGDPVQAVGPLDATFAAGHTTALVGPSGCGKSSLLRMIAGLERPSAGTIRIGAETPRDLTRRAALAMAFQDAALLPWRSVRSNVALGLSLARQPPDAARIERLIGLVGLAGFNDRRPAELSGGMRQRAAIARCLVSAPELLLLDEPFGAVDELTRRRLNRDLPALWQGTTAILVTHSVVEAAMLADRVLVLSPRPATIMAEIDIPLPRPRDEDDAALRDRIAAIAAALRDSGPDRVLAAQ